VAASDCPVISVTWWTTPLPGKLVGSLLGGLHSVLAVLVELPDAQHRQRYFLEKAQAPERFPNGVIASRWIPSIMEIGKSWQHTRERAE
jgi:hypothetical protein